MAIRFDAATDGLSDDGGTPTGGVATVCCWAYLSATTGSNQAFVQLNNGDSNPNGDGLWLDYFNSAATLRAEIDGAGFGTAGTYGPITTGTWYFCALVLNGTSLTHYARSTAESSLTSANATVSPPNSGSWSRIWIGNDQYGSGLNGRVAAVKVWDAALTSTELLAESSQFAPVRTANLLRYHPFHVAELTDYSGNGNTLTAGSTSATTEADPPIPDHIDPLRVPVQTIRVP